ncbi:hypothetical protein L3Q82_024361, partial [Scortum barcoo]
FRQDLLLKHQHVPTCPYSSGESLRLLLKALTPEENTHCQHGLYFQDGQRRVDYVLTYPVKKQAGGRSSRQSAHQLTENAVARNPHRSHQSCDEHLQHYQAPKARTTSSLPSSLVADVELGCQGETFSGHEDHKTFRREEFEGKLRDMGLELEKDEDSLLLLVTSTLKCEAGETGVVPFTFLRTFKLRVSQHIQPAPVVYTREQLLALSQASSANPLRERPEIPAELRRRRRGSSAGVKRHEWRRWYKPCLPSVITGNVRSLLNKMEELAALTRLQREYRECSLMHFTETWLNHLTPDSLVQLDGFHLVRADRNTRESGKKKGGGIALLFVNDKCV